MSWEWCPGGAGIAGMKFAFEGGFAMIRTRSGFARSFPSDADEAA